MSQPEKIALLKQAFGSEVELIAEDGAAEPFRIVAEFRIVGTDYAGLQTAAMRKADEIAFFRIVSRDGNDPELESIEDEDEWELAAEACDDLLFGGDDRP